ncbi:hypothetical protein A2997_00435 [Candidatus Nomurabacteria bacterium RIFCSPLOWO2_01_FULL_36_10b]|uniref:Uncharacterized protein n=1 Tax=Candidatus Nomurabacteria bacterium RIFCSPLOWO2_01_FULL_36_10b TaxID=1801766 RepID=A0A1F6WQ59_9BACT|nr:MAG: hypothetical protein A2997_00435 [Candidatus Nomurabacteria bacterium RIFCSPLOWO2_01_FULL_36_10b]
METEQHLSTNAIHEALNDRIQNILERIGKRISSKCKVSSFYHGFCYDTAPYNLYFHLHSTTSYPWYKKLLEIDCDKEHLLVSIEKVRGKIHNRSGEVLACIVMKKEFLEIVKKEINREEAFFKKYRFAFRLVLNDKTVAVT